MREEDKKNLVRAWPFYLVLIAILGFLSWQSRNRSSRIDPQKLDKMIAKTIDPTGLKALVAKAKTWEPTMLDSFGKPAPDLVCRDIDGIEHRLSEFRGKKVIVLFWATWCPPCNREIPELIDLRKEIDDDALGILALSSEPISTVKPFALENGLNYTVVADIGDLPRPFSDVRGIPSAFYIDTRGIIQFISVGMVPGKDTRTILDAIP
jgi:peroxiredoxin